MLGKKCEAHAFAHNFMNSYKFFSLVQFKVTPKFSLIDINEFYAIEVPKVQSEAANDHRMRMPLAENHIVFWSSAFCGGLYLINTFL